MLLGGIVQELCQRSLLLDTSLEVRGHPAAHQEVEVVLVFLLEKCLDNLFQTTYIRYLGLEPHEVQHLQLAGGGHVGAAAEVRVHAGDGDHAHRAHVVTGQPPRVGLGTWQLCDTRQYT